MKYKINRFGCSKTIFRDMVIGYAQSSLHKTQSPKKLKEVLDVVNKCIEDDEDKHLKQLRLDLEASIENFAQPSF